MSFVTVRHWSICNDLFFMHYIWEFNYIVGHFSWPEQRNVGYLCSSKGTIYTCLERGDHSIWCACKGCLLSQTQGMRSKNCTCMLYLMFVVDLLCLGCSIFKRTKHFCFWVLIWKANMWLFICIEFYYVLIVMYILCIHLRFTTWGMWSL